MLSVSQIVYIYSIVRKVVSFERMKKEQENFSYIYLLSDFLLHMVSQH